MPLEILLGLVVFGIAGIAVLTIWLGFGARRALSEGFEPFAISTDLHLRNLHGPVHDLALTASKLHALGMGLEACVAAITERPRSVLGLAGATGATPGARADFTLFRMADIDLTVADSMGKKLHLSRVFDPLATVIGASHRPARSRRPQAGEQPA